MLQYDYAKTQVRPPFSLYWAPIGESVMVMDLHEYAALLLIMLLVLGLPAGEAEMATEERQNAYICELEEIPALSADVQLLNQGKNMSISIEARDDDPIRKIIVDIARSEEEEGFYRGHITFNDTAYVINLVLVERWRDKYNVSFRYDPRYGWRAVKSIGIGESAMLIYSYVDQDRVVECGVMTITVDSERHIEILIDLYSNVSFSAISNSVVVWVAGYDCREFAVRRFYEDAVSGAQVFGVYPYVNRTDYPYEPLEYPYAKMIEVNGEYYVTERVMVFCVMSELGEALFNSSALSFRIGGGPMVAYFALAAEPWDFFCDEVGRLEIFFGSSYWGYMRFFRFHYYESRKYWADKLPVILMIVFLVAAIVYRVRKEKEKQSDAIRIPTREGSG